MTDDIFYDEGLTEKQIIANVELALTEISAQKEKKDCYAYIFKSGIDKSIKISYAKKSEIDTILQNKGDLTVRQLMEYNADKLYNRMPARRKKI